MISRQVAKTAGELSELFKYRTNDYPQWKLQQEIHCILVNNGLKENKEEWWQK